MCNPIYYLNFSFYEIVKDNAKLIDTYVNQLETENKESLEKLLKKLGYEFIGNDDLWGFRTENIIIIAEIKTGKSINSHHCKLHQI